MKNSENNSFNYNKFIVQKLDGWYFYDKTFTNITGPYEFKSVCILNCINFHIEKEKENG